MGVRFTTRLTAAVLGLGLLAASACSSDKSDASDDDAKDEDEAVETVFPGDEWTTGDPEELGFDPAKLEEIAAAAEADSSFCLLVVRHGKVAGEWYWGESTPTSASEVFSATKSYASTLVGIAQAEGKLDIDDKVSEYVPEWVGTPSEDVTIKNLISNDSGRHWDYRTDYMGLVGAPDRTAFGISLAQDADPGTVWVYNNSAIQVLEAVLEEATGQQVADYADEKIFSPLGMGDSEMTKDGAGNTNVFFGLQSTCRDMARFGLLFLNKGSWDGDEVVPEAWVDEAVGAPSTDLNSGYGYLWWLNRHGAQPNPGSATNPDESGPDAAPPQGQAVPDAPEDMYWAHGLGNQLISVDPGSDTVVVRLGPMSDTITGFGRDDIAKVVTEALVDP